MALCYQAEKTKWSRPSETLTIPFRLAARIGIYFLPMRSFHQADTSFSSNQWQHWHMAFDIESYFIVLYRTPGMDLFHSDSPAA